MVRPSRPAPLMLDEPFMLFSGPCSAAEQGAGMLSPCSADASPKPGSTRAAAAAVAAPSGSGSSSSANIIHSHPHTVSGARIGGAHFNAPSPPRRPRPAAITIVEEDAPATQQQAEANQASVRSDASLEVDLPQRPATTRARGGAFNNFFFKRSGSSSVLNALSGSGATTPASGAGAGAGAGGGKGVGKKKRAFPGFTPKGLGGVGFGGLSMTPRHQDAAAAAAVAAEKGGGASGGKDGASPIFGGLGLSRGASFMALLTRRPSLSTKDTSGHSTDDMDHSSTSTSATSSLSSSTSQPGAAPSAGAPRPRAGGRAKTPVDLYAAAMNFHYDGTKILEWLYMGGESIPSQQALSQTFGISHIVNTTMDAHYPHHDPAHGDYCQLFLRDCVRQQISPETFQRAFDMIERARHHGEKCLVHCRNGMSRSATIVIAYLMKHQGMRLIDALAHARGRRPCVSPNPGFMDLLCKMEMDIFGEVSLDAHHYHDDRFGCIESLRLPLGAGAVDGGEAAAPAPSPKGAAAAAE